MLGLAPLSEKPVLRQVDRAWPIFGVSPSMSALEISLQPTVRGKFELA